MYFLLSLQNSKTVHHNVLKMKRIEKKRHLQLTVFTVILMLLFYPSFGQDHLPVAVNDTVFVLFNQTQTIPVLRNDYDPDGEKIKIVAVGGNDYLSYTDSTINFFFLNKYKDFSVKYAIEDSHGNLAGASIVFKVNNKTFIDINNVRALVNPFGNQFWDLNGNDYFEFPKGSGHNMSYNNALWLGGFDHDRKLHIAAETYRKRGADFWTGPLSKEQDVFVDSTQNFRWNRVWKVSKKNIEYHINHWDDEGYIMPRSIRTWPAQGNTEMFQNAFLAPFVDVDYDQEYHPEKGDYPLIKGDQSIFFIFNDLKTHMESKGLPMGVEIHGMVWAIHDTAKPWYDNTVFLHYEIHNRSNENYTNCFVGLFTDSDIDSTITERLSCDIQRSSILTKGDESDDSGKIIPPSVGVVLLGGPKLFPDFVDNEAGLCDESINGIGFGDETVDNERMGMTRFITYNKKQLSNQGYPFTPQEYYNYLNAKWKDGSPLQYGGFGTFETGAYGPECHFMFPGETDPCFWGTGGIEPYGPVNWNDNPTKFMSKQKNSLASTGPFVFKANSYENFDVAFVCAWDSTEKNSTHLLQTYIDSIRADFLVHPQTFGNIFIKRLPPSPPLNLSPYIYPNPATDKIILTLPEDPVANIIDIYTLAGEKVFHRRLPSQLSYSIDIRDFASGFYILRLISDDHVISGKFVKR